MSDDEVLFTDDEFEEYFGGASEPLPPRSRRLPAVARLLGYAVVFAMFGGAILTLLDNVRTNPDIREPLEIEAAAWDSARASPLGWLVDDIIVTVIDRPQVGAFVSNNPPDGVITLDLRPWNQDQLDELMDHEIGHLLDFALWEPGDPGRKGGLGTEVWAECAAVEAGTRRLDPRDPGGEYRCLASDLAVYDETLDSISEVCKRWGDRECRPLRRSGANQ